MTPKERILSAIRGETVDRMPWSPFLAYWWEAQSESLRSQGQLNYLESLGADPMLRGFGAPWRTIRSGVEVRETRTALEKVVLWETPVGTLRFGYKYSPAGDTWFLVDHPIVEAEDFKILQWVFEHTTLEYDGEIDRQHREIGERGVLMPIIGSECKTCFQSMVETWVGTEGLTYLLADEPEAVEECLAVMRGVSDRTAELCAQCEAESFIFWEDSSTTNISPDMFRKYTAPEIAFWADRLHAAGKLLIHHACGHLKALLPLMAETGADAIESISPPPTGNIDIADAYELLPQRVALIGGIEPVFYQSCTRDQLDARVDELLRIARGRRFVLANSDSCPPAVEEWKLRRVTELLRG